MALLMTEVAASYCAALESPKLSSVAASSILIQRIA